MPTYVRTRMNEERLNVASFTAATYERMREGPSVDQGFSLFGEMHEQWLQSIVVSSTYVVRP